MPGSPSIQPVIVGSDGMLGRDLSDVLTEAHPQTVCATQDEIDITDYWRIRWELERLEATVVVNCAAFTDVDACETHAQHAWRVNAEGAGNLARACRANGARIIHLSTDFVFDGRQEAPYREDDPTHPLSEYARSKLEGERAVAAENPDRVILRCSWLYGPHGKNFVSSILGAARAGRTLRVVTDQRGTPTYTTDLAQAITRIVSLEYQGVLHFANSGVCSRFEFAREALRLAGMEEVGLEPIASEELEDRPARRPAYSALDTGRFTGLTGMHPRPWEETLRDYLDATR